MKTLDDVKRSLHARNIRPSWHEHLGPRCSGKQCPKAVKTFVPVGLGYGREQLECTVTSRPAIQYLCGPAVAAMQKALDQ